MSCDLDRVAQSSFSPLLCVSPSGHTGHSYRRPFAFAFSSAWTAFLQNCVWSIHCSVLSALCTHFPSSQQPSLTTPLNIMPPWTFKSLGLLQSPQALMLSNTMVDIYLFVCLSHWKIPSARAGTLLSCSLLGPDAGHGAGSLQGTWTGWGLWYIQEWVPIHRGSCDSIQLIVVTRDRYTSPLWIDIFFMGKT